MQQLLACAIHKYQSDSQFHDESIRMMLSDAWEELRMKPTALSAQDLMQLSFEINRTIARKSLIGDLSARYERMLLNPFFGRIDFQEDGRDEVEKIVIGLYSLRDEHGQILVHDWRAPVCDLYYNASLGPVSYTAADGEITGVVTLKRQYRMENGRLKYFVDTDVSIDDDLLLDILSNATTRHMRTIVTTIQKEQNTAIRLDGAPVLSVTGAAGSGKTSVAMHRAAYLIYQHPETLDSRHITILSPGSAFSEYISKVLPDLGEEAVDSVTQYDLLTGIIPGAIETPLEQNERFLKNGDDFLEAMRKSTREFSLAIESYIDEYTKAGPDFKTIALGDIALADEAEMKNMYSREYTSLIPAQRITRIRSVIDTRLERWAENLKTQYRQRMLGDYTGRDLDMAVNMAVSQRLAPVRRQVKKMLQADPLAVYEKALKRAGLSFSSGKRLNWEDAAAVAYITLRLGLAQPNRLIQHLIIDEAQDYAEITLKALRLYFPNARVTMLGDLNQRTTACDGALSASDWNAAMGEINAPVINLSKCYRSTLPITRFCNALLPLQSMPGMFGREGEFPIISEYDPQLLVSQIDEWKKDASLRIIGVVSRSQEQTDELARLFPDGVVLTGESDDSLPDRGVVIAGYHLVKGLEFDAVAVVWPVTTLDDQERRRLYTACSRALHALRLFTGKALIRDIGIVV
ncbi:MAG: AAA family ATPase [Clostridia bacterium]|nr:AAA family ATPase [Clostridia bacterium]